MLRHLKVTTLIYIAIYALISFLKWEVITPLTTLNAMPHLDYVWRALILATIIVVNLVTYVHFNDDNQEAIKQADEQRNKQLKG